jgi:uncharacterized membrane protein YraQ (UPF0718 family)
MLSIVILLILTIVSLIISFILDKKKTFDAVKRGLKMFMNLLPPFITILILVSILLYFTPTELLIKWLGKESGAGGMLLAAAVGSISLIPGFIAFPLGSILIKSGVSYSVIGIFITTLMMVGVVTLPLEKKFFGLKTAVIRNILSFFGAVIIGILIGALWSVI